MPYTPNWTYGMIMPNGDNTESESYDSSLSDNGNGYIHTVPEAVGKGKTLYGNGGIVAGTLKTIITKED